MSLSGARLQQVARGAAEVEVDPHHGDALRRDHDSITRGRYLDKEHWISVGAGPGVTRRLVEQLVQESYDLVADRAGKTSP
ncbi:hypothetical protein FA014_00625 [Cellulomonas hominis]|uniref:Uncharacterized protein n=1 Tax=Cellulomonas hominis TaxID=156981 RepID=A0A7Z8NT63_9CELL|nr:MmcQ/YjbR family DNA-binding protein [Cellulomonas hominis]TKR27377.1 hypothetical protein FA014_00625 [Cellulomonas hominis]